MGEKPNEEENVTEPSTSTEEKPKEEENVTAPPSTTGHLEGYLIKWPLHQKSMRLTSGEKKRYFILEAGELKYFEHQNGKQLGVIPVTASLSVETDDTNPSMFHLVQDDGNVLKFKGLTSESTEEWLSAFRQAVIEKQLDIQDKEVMENP